MILRLNPELLRKMADQLEALTKMEEAGADHLRPNTVIRVDGQALAYASWWEDGRQYLAEVVCFTPGDATPLDYHTDEHSDLTKMKVRS